MEFAEGMKQLGRMCNGHCADCPLAYSNNGTGFYCESFIKNYPETAEKLIIKWAEEHPVKTNRDVFIEAIQEKFGDKLNKNYLSAMLDEHGCELFSGVDCIGTTSCKDCKLYKFWDEEYKESKL